MAPRVVSQTVRLAISVALLLGALLAVQFRPSSETVQLRKPFSTFPAALGGWKDTRTILDCYIQTDEGTQRTMLESRARAS